MIRRRIDECQAPARIAQVPGMCNKVGLDLTVGCEHACAYCHFQTYQALTLRHAYDGQPLAAQQSVAEFLQQENYPPEIYLSPFTDPLAPAARDNLDKVLRRVLPRGIRVGLSTKGIVPRRVFRLLAQNPDQPRLIVGVTSLDDPRNAAVEPGCPPAKARLANLRLAREYGLTKVTARLDPLLPDVDDAPEQLRVLLDQVAAAGAQTVSASYLFVTPFGSKERLRRMPFLGRAVDQCTELCPIEGAGVMSVPLERKREMYEWLHRECADRGLSFATCGCKDLRLNGASFGTACSYPCLSDCAAPTVVGRKHSIPV